MVPIPCCCCCCCCSLLTIMHQDCSLWWHLFVEWIRTAKTDRWGKADESAIHARFRPAFSAQSGEEKDGEGGWYFQFKKCTSALRHMMLLFVMSASAEPDEYTQQGYQQWRFGTITGGGERWTWDRHTKTLSGFSFATRAFHSWSFDG